MSSAVRIRLTSLLEFGSFSLKYLPTDVAHENVWVSSQAGPGHPEGYPGPIIYSNALQRRHGTRMYSTTSPSRSCSDSTTRPRNTQPSMQAWGRRRSREMRNNRVIGGCLLVYFGHGQ